MVSGHELYELLFGGGSAKESHTWGTVDAVNQDGTADVRLNPSISTTCTCLAEVKAGDRVLVLVFKQGAVVLGKAV